MNGRTPTCTKLALSQAARRFGGVHGLENVEDARGHVAVDLLLVLVQKNDSSRSGETREGAHALEHGVALGGGTAIDSAPSGAVEREDADVGRVECVRRGDHAPKPHDLVLDRQGDIHLADRGRDRGHPHRALPEHAPEGRRAARPRGRRRWFPHALRTSMWRAPSDWSTATCTVGSGSISSPKAREQPGGCGAHGTSAFDLTI